MTIAFTLFLVSVVAFGVAIFTYKYNSENIMTTTFGIIGFFSLIFSMPFYSLEHTEDYVVHDNIYSVKGTNDEVSGQFFLGSGRINERTYYIVFVKDKYGIKMEKYNVCNTYIVEVSDNHYYIRYIKKKWEFKGKYLLYVPEGTVIVEYKI